MFAPFVIRRLSHFSAVLIALCFGVSSARCELLTIRLPTRKASGLYPFPRLEPATPRLTLALSGGSLRGAAHLGALKVLEEEGIPIQGIAGTSIGALIGGLYSTGFTTNEIYARLRLINWSRILFDEPERSSLLLARKEEHSRQLLMIRLDSDLAPVVPGALSPGQRLYRILLELTLGTPYRPVTDWDQLPIPLRVVSTDLVTGRQVTLDRGDLALGIRGSLSLPLLFDPLALDSLQLIDGGISANIPVAVARQMGGDIVVAVDATADLMPLELRYQPWQIVDQVTTILGAKSNVQALLEADVVVAPDFGSDTANTGMEYCFRLGYEAMRKQIPRLKALLNPSPLPDDSTFLAFSRISYTTEIGSSLFDSSLSAAPAEWVAGGGANIREIRDYLRKAYHCGTIADAGADYDREGSILVVHFQLTPWLNELTFSGDRIFPDDLLRAPFLSQLGSRLNYDSLQVALKTTLEGFRERGYPLMTFAALHYDSSRGQLNLKIDAGRLREVKFIGLKRVPEALLAREIPLRPGQPVTRDAILEGTSNLYATDLFRSVYPSFLHARDGWILEMRMSEQPALPVRLGLAYQDERRTRGFIELVYPAPFYYALRMTVFTAIGELDRIHRLTLQADRIAGLPFTYDLSASFEQKNRRVYNREHHSIGNSLERRWGGRLELGGQAPSWGLLAFTARLEEHHDQHPDQKNEYPHQYPDQENVYPLAAVGARLAVDTQDRTPFPKRGIHTEAALETAGKYLGSEEDFSKIWGSWEGYYTPFRRYTFGGRLGGGTSDRTIPQDEQFRLGGIDSFPGLHLDEVVGGMQMWGGSELRYDLISRILADSYIGLRYDIAGSWSDASAQITRRDWMQSVSFYIALDTFLGPFKLGWGYLLDRGAVAPQQLLHIQVGNMF